MDMLLTFICVLTGEVWRLKYMQQLRFDHNCCCVITSHSTEACHNRNLYVHGSSLHWLWCYGRFLF